MKNGEEITTLKEKNSSLIMSPFCVHFILFAILFLQIIFFTQSAVAEFYINNAEAIMDEGTGVNSVRACDIDLDGDTDIIMIYRGSDTNKILWLENVGALDNTMVKHDIYAGNDDLASPVIADMNGDERPDIVIFSNTQNFIRYYRNNISGGVIYWTLHTVASSYSGVTSVVANDFDKDGDMDILSSSIYDFYIKWFENKGGAGTTWASQNIVSATGAVGGIVIADFNKDGRNDVAGYVSKSIYWWENTGSSYTPHAVHNDIDGIFQELLAADFNLDGYPDLIGYNDKLRTSWWENPATGTTWSPYLILGASYNRGMFLDDLDNDGDIDMLMFNATAYRYVFYENTRTIDAMFVPDDLTGSNFPQSFDVYDMDRDGDMDVLGTSNSEANIQVHWYPNESIHRNVKFASHNDIATDVLNPKSICSGDFNNDGLKDFAVASFDENSVWEYSNTSAAKGSTPTWTKNLVNSISNGVSAIEEIDLNKDGKMDIVSASTTGNTVRWHKNIQPLVWSSAVIDNAAYKTNSVAAADFDGDGDIDVAYSSASSSSASTFYIYIALNDGTPDTITATDWTKITIDVPRGQVSLSARDMDHDGDMDIVAVFENEGNLWIYQNDGNPTPGFYKIFVDDNIDYIKSAYPADIDKDGDMDIVAAGSVVSIAETTGYVVYYENDPAAAGGWTKTVVDNALLGAASVYADDFDNDGDIDIVSTFKNATKSSSSGTTMYISNGAEPPVFTKLGVVSTVNFGNFPPTYSAVCADDFDNDGDKDIITSVSNNKISFHENTGARYSVAISNTSPTTIDPGVTEDIFKIVLTHNGRAGDSKLRISNAQFYFEKSGGAYMTSDELENIVLSLSIYLDDGSGIFEPAIDKYIIGAPGFSLNVGYEELELPSYLLDLKVDAATSKTFFITTKIKSDAAFQNPSEFKATFVSSAQYPVILNSSAGAVIDHEPLSSISTNLIDITSNVTEETIKDHLIGRNEVPPADQSQLDTNSDTKIDSADLVTKINQ